MISETRGNCGSNKELFALICACTHNTRHFKQILNDITTCSEMIYCLFVSLFCDEYGSLFTYLLVQ